MRLLFALLLLLLTSPAWAATYYITPTGLGVKDGSAWSAASSFATFEEGAQNGNWVAGDHFFIAGDTTYTATGNMDPGGTGSAASPIIVAGVSPEFTSGGWRNYAASGTSRPLFVMGANQWNLGNFVMHHSLRIESTNTTSTLDCGSCLVAGCSIYNNSTVGGDDAITKGTGVIYDSELYSKNAWGVIVTGDGNVSFNYFRGDNGLNTGSAEISTAYNIFDGIVDTALYLGGSYQVHLNNTFYNCGIGIDTRDTSYAASLLVNNIFDNCTIALRGASGQWSGIYGINNNFNDSGTTYAVRAPDPTDTTHYPYFVDAVGGDFEPAENSPVVTGGKQFNYGVGD